MAGTVTLTEQLTTSTVKLIIFDWTSDASGDADKITAGSIDGDILLFVTVPDGVAAPTANYDLTITDENGIDVIAGAGADRSATAAEYVQSTSLGAVAGSKLTLAVANAGNAKQGKAYLYVR